MWPFSKTSSTIATLDKIVNSTVVQSGLNQASEVLPCELAFGLTAELDTDLFSRMRESGVAAPRQVPWSSVTATKAGYLGLPVPQFDLIDPFYIHKLNPKDTARRLLFEAMHEGQTRAGLFSVSLSSFTRVRREVAIPQGGALLVECDGSTVRFGSALGWRNADHESKAAKDAWMRASGWHAIALYCTIPGYIKPEDRQKIRDAKELADKVGGECRLLVEADWKVAEHIVARNVDPLIVIRKGTDLAYIDRFDCTAAEEHLAREHAVRR